MDHELPQLCPQPRCVPKAPLPKRLFPSSTHQARIPLGLTDLCAELLQFQLVHLQVGSGGSHTTGSGWDAVSRAPTPHSPHQASTHGNTSPFPVPAHRCGKPLHGMWWDVGPHTIWDTKATCPRELACPCLLRAESCQSQAVSQAVPMPLRSSLPPPTLHLRQALLESFVHLVQAVGLRHLGWWGFVGH